MNTIKIIDNLIYLLGKMKLYYNNTLTETEKTDYKLLKTSCIYFIKELLKILKYEDKGED